MTEHAPGLPFSLDPLIAEAKRRMRRRRLLVVAVLLTAAAAVGSVYATRSPGGPGSGGRPGGHGALSAPGRTGSVPIDAGGAVGPLQMNRSSRRQVIAWAGKPSVLRTARENGRTEYVVLGYACKPGAGTEGYWTAYPIACQTSFYFVDRKLSLFITEDPRFAASGVVVGTPMTQAERLLHARAHSGCVSAIGLEGKQTRLTVSLGGGPHGPAQVNAFYVHGSRNTSATDCD